LEAAGQGPRAIEHDGVLDPCPEDLAALEWMERYPPDGMFVPSSTVNAGDVVAYRTRTLEKRASGWRFRKPAVPHGSVAIGGVVAWTWSAEPARRIRESLDALCADVSHLGTAQSPVRLWVGTAAPTHRLRADAEWWSKSAGDMDVLVPCEGRTAARMSSYRADHPVAVPERSRIVRTASTEKDIPPTRASMVDCMARYSPVTTGDPAPSGPWSTVLLAELNRTVPGPLRVGWSVAMHRALIKQIGDGAPAVLTGRYAQGVRPPANRCSIQILGSDQARLLGSDAPALLALMLPSDISPAEAAEISMAFARVQTLTRQRGAVLRVSPLPRTRSARTFWPQPAPGCIRLWRTDPAAVNETRPQRSDWTLNHTAALSVGLVFRQQMQVPDGRGATWYQSLAEAARNKGLTILSASHVRDDDLSCYVHHFTPGLTLLPYRARLDLGDLAGPCAVTAIGQSRHLGGGLLVPDDSPDGR
jgi:CRISPR-associated protein Csb2